MSSTFHARSAAAYDQFMGRWSRRLASPFIAFCATAPGGRCLDVGCGTGNLTRALAAESSVRNVVGVDLAEVYLDAAHRDNRDPRITFETADATRLPFADHSFDNALTMLVLQFIPDTAAAIREMRRVVKPGGVVGAAVWDSMGGMPALRLMWDAAAHLGLADDKVLRDFYFRPMTRPGELQTAWRDAGLTHVEQSSVTIRMEFADFADYWTPIAAGEAAPGKFAAGLAAADLARLEQAVRRSYCGGLPDGPRSFAATCWVCRGTVAA